MQFFLKLIALLVVGLIFLGGPVLIYLVKFDNKTPVGAFVKVRVLKVPGISSLLNLNEPGDGRFIYLDPEIDTIKVRVEYADSMEPHQDAEQWISDMIFQTTGKTAEISMASSPLKENLNAYSMSDLNALRSEMESSSDPTVTIAYVPTFADTPTYAGITVHRDTLFIFKRTLTELSPKSDEQSKLEQSTLMHEWGHLLGMEHNDFESCIMSAKAEVHERANYNNSISTEYCWDELYQFRQMNHLPIQ